MSKREERREQRRKLLEVTTRERKLRAPTKAACGRKKNVVSLVFSLDASQFQPSPRLLPPRSSIACTVDIETRKQPRGDSFSEKRNEVECATPKKKKGCWWCRPRIKFAYPTLSALFSSTPRTRFSLCFAPLPRAGHRRSLYSSQEFRFEATEQGKRAALALPLMDRKEARANKRKNEVTKTNLVKA